MKAEEIRQQISTWKYLAEGLTQEHQQSVRNDILRKVENLEDQLKAIEEQPKPTQADLESFDKSMFSFDEPKPDTSQVETAEEILELNTGHSIDYLRRNAFSVDDVINAMYKFASQRKEVTDDDIENWIKTRHFTGSGQNDYAATLRDGMRIGAKALRDNKIG